MNLFVILASIQDLRQPVDFRRRQFVFGRSISMSQLSPNIPSPSEQIAFLIDCSWVKLAAWQIENSRGSLRHSLKHLEFYEFFTKQYEPQRPWHFLYVRAHTAHIDYRPRPRASRPQRSAADALCHTRWSAAGCLPSEATSVTETEFVNFDNETKQNNLYDFLDRSGRSRVCRRRFAVRPFHTDFWV